MFVTPSIMRFAVLLSVCTYIATTSLSNAGEFSQVLDLQALKLGVPELDAILLKTHSLIDTANGFLLVLLVPWNRFPGFVLYQRYSPFFLVRHASEVSVLALVALLAGIPLSYFLARGRGDA